jgi:SpoVK/Ycf46/Vps4 family AAA+-type ATPase
MKLSDSKLKELHEIAVQVRLDTKTQGSRGFSDKLSQESGQSILFVGASETEKALAAKTLSQILGLDLCRVDMSKIANKFIGETEKNLGLVFKEAEKENKILFFDEADALFGKQTEVKDSNDRYSNMEVRYLLQRIESYLGIAILSTNSKVDIDQAFSRRIWFMLEFP